MYDLLPIADGHQQLLGALHANEFRFPPHRLLDLLFALLGSEVEGKPAQVCILCGPTDASSKIDRLLGSWQLPRRMIPQVLIQQWTDKDSTKFREHAQTIISLVTSGCHGVMPVIVISQDSTLLHLALLPEAYEAAHLPAGLFGAFVRSKWSLELKVRANVFQWLRLRDGSGYVLRDRDRLAVSLTRAVEPPLNRHAVIHKLVDLSMELSRSGVGAALYITSSRGEAELLLRSDQVVAKRTGIINPIPISAKELLSHLMSFDGAVVVFIELDQIFVADYGVYFHGPGGRRATASHVAREIASVRAVLVVSQDGALYFLSREPIMDSAFDSCRYR